MTLTGAELLTGFSRFIGDEVEPGGLSLTSAGAADGTTIVDTKLRQFGEDSLIDWYIRINDSDEMTANLLVRRITSFTASSGTVTVAPAWGEQIDSGTVYELHRWHPSRKFQALDEARKTVYPDLAQIIYDDTLTGDGIARAADIPSSIRRGPAYVMEETPISPETEWNFLADPKGDSTSNWTASSLTASTYERTDSDLLIPKYDDVATKLVVAASTAGTYRQTVGSMQNGITATLAAGREMTFAAWVYSRVASKIAVEFLDDSGAVSTSAQHKGRGWELLTATGVVDGNNATTLTAGFTVDNDSTPFTGYWNRAWFYFGGADRVRDNYDKGKARRVRRDDTTQRLYFDFTPHRGHQLRLIGRDILSGLGTVASTQVTNTMEVDEESAQVLYAEAARVFFRWQRLSLGDFPEVQARVDESARLRQELARTWSTHLPHTASLKSAWVA